MLPSTYGQSSHYSSSPASPAKQALTFIRRIGRFPQLDFELAMRQMADMCFRPRKLYRSLYYHRQTKNQWARDDPAYIVMLSLYIAASAIVYGITFGIGFTSTFTLILYMLLVDFLFFGSIIAAAGWYISNQFLNSDQQHNSRQEVELAYAFDIHCNSYFPFFLLTHVLTFILHPVTLYDGFLTRFLANTVWMIGGGWYVYGSWLGYSTLPFLHGTGIFLYPLPVLAIVWFISLFAFNVSNVMMSFYGLT